MRKRILLYLFVLSMIFSGGYLFAQEAVAPQIQQQPETAQGGDKIQARVDQLTKELNLTVEQQTKIKEILTKATEEIRVILQSTKEQTKELRIKAHDEIMNLLTQEQKDKFKVTRKKHEATP
ncbi:MAG: hypothetical protein PHY94_06790 [Candidatus Omnitrophica bacterium]|nr:hypothetical protein [Candidatus Omnitrophota bacterium]